MMVQTEIGLLPEDWEVKAIGECASLKAGDIVDIDTTSRKIYPCYGGNGIRGFVSKYTHEGTFPIIGRQGEWCGNVNLASGRFYATEHAVVARPNKTTDAVCLYYFLKDANLNQYATGCAQPGLSVQNINKILIPFPKNKTEQQNIASALSSIDKLIDDLGRTIQKKQLIREGAMEELLSGKKRLPGFTEDWVENTFDELFKPYSTASYSREEMIEGNVLCIHYGDIHTKYGSVVYLDSDEIQTITKEQAGRYTRLKDGDIIMADASEDYEGIGKCIAVITCGKEAIAGLHTILLRPKANDLFDHRFTSYILSHRSTKKQIEYLSEGTKVNSISFNKIKAVTVTYPSSLKEQRTIADILTSMDDEISVLQIEKTKYEQIRSGMMEELLTGKKRLTK